MSADEAPIDIVVVGAGPAGLAAAATARRAGAGRIVLLERQGEPGGVPRQCGHSPYGMREFHRVLSGRAYTRRLVDEARAAGVEIRSGHSVVELTAAAHTPSPAEPTLRIVSSEGQATLSPHAVIVATGVRETTRAAALLPGQRPGGVLNTGALQDLVYLRGRVPFHRPVVLGSELVTMSALITCATHGMRPVALIESAPQPILRAPLRWLPRALGIPWHLGAKLLDVEGTERVRGVRVRLADGGERAFECDGLLLTGRFVPEASLLRGAGATMDAATQGPCIDDRGRTSLSGVYAVGNVLRGVETAGWAWAEGGRVARAVVDDLGADRARASEAADAAGERHGGIELVAGRGVARLVPQRLAVDDAAARRPGVGGDARDRAALAFPDVQLRLTEVSVGRVVARQGGEVILSRRVRSGPERRVLVPVRDVLRGARTGTVEFSVEAT